MHHWEIVRQLIGEPRRGAEIGVRTGDTTSYLLDRFPKLTLYAVDSWVAMPAMDRVGFQTYADWDFGAIRKTFDQRMRAFGGRVITLAMESLQAAAEVPDGSLDFVFIDAEHTYEGVAADIAAWRPKVKSGGILCGHDYGHERFPGVKRAVDECLSVEVVDTVWWTRV